MKIQWLDDEGSFKVIGGTLKEIPAGWKETEPNVFVPQWVECRFRQLSYGSNNGVPYIKPYCTHFDKEVDFSICQGCTEHKPKRKSSREVPKSDAPDIDGFKIINIPEKPQTHEPTGIKITGPFAHLANVQPKQGWAPCMFRILKPQDDDCGGCKKFLCNNPEHPKYKKRVYKSLCEKCDLRKE